MKRLLAVASACAIAVAAFAAYPSSAPAEGDDYKVVEVKNGGTIKGVVRLSGKTAIPMVKVTKDKDKGCGEDHASERIVYDEATLGLGNCLVYLKSIAAGKDWPESMKSEDRTFLLDQKGCKYIPHVSWFRTGTQLVIGNDDKAEHNIHGYRNTMSDTQFNVSSEPGSKKDNIEQAYLEKPATYIVKCDIHPWMSAYAFVVEHPYYALTSATDKPGEFVLENVPEGEYVLVIWKEGMVATPMESDGKISSYTYSADIVREFPVKVEAGKTVEMAPYAIDAPAAK